MNKWRRWADDSVIVISVLGEGTKSVCPIFYEGTKPPTGTFHWSMMVPKQDPKDIVIERICRPWKVAIKSLLKDHLPPIAATFCLDPQAREIGEVLGVLFTLEGTAIAPEDLVAKVLENPNTFAYQGKHTQDVEAIQAAAKLFSKLDTLRSLLKNHKHLERVPMYRGDSLTKPYPEDQELNDLLKESETLSKMYHKNYMILMYPSSIEWPTTEGSSHYLFDTEDLCQSVQDVLDHTQKGERC
jgi:hypothetical protein